MNLAIIIGVAEYDNADKLDACLCDAKVMHELIDATKKYDDVLYLYNTGRVESSVFKDKIPEFIEKHESEDIEEVFFYYSGHGSIYKEDFLYIPSDYNRSRINMTTVKGEEIDNLLRRLNAKLTIKVIDACHCGEQYVKDTDDYTKSVDKSSKTFNNCYFLFSSHNTQTSAADDKMSRFTKSFFCAIRDISDTEIKYRSLMDYISDEFATNAEQTPYFVNQGNYREIFCSKTKDVVDSVTNSLSGKTTSPDPTKIVEESSLLRAIKKDESNYRSMQDICTMLEQMKSDIGSTAMISELTGIFELEILCLEGLDMFNRKTEVGEWLQKNKNTYWAKYKTSSTILGDSIFPPLFTGVKEDKTSQLSFLQNLPSTYVSGYTVEVELPYQTILVNFKSLHQNVNDYAGIITFVVSSTSLRYFYYLCQASQGRINSMRSISDLATIDCKFSESDSVKVGYKNVVNKIQTELLDKLNEEFLDGSTGLMN